MPIQGRDAFDDQRDADWETLARFVAGESSAAEAAMVEEHLSRSSEDAALVGALERFTSHLSQQSSSQGDLDVERALARVRNRFTEKEVPSLETARMRRRFRNVPAWWGALAATLVAAAALAVWFNGRHGTGVQATRTANARTYSSPIGGRDSVRLDDGTRVLLGPGSTLTVSAGFGRGERDVTLRGEAFIEVAHKQGPPFMVHAGAASIRDVGTAFAVHSDVGTGVRVVVTQGAVVLRRTASADSGTLLREGDVGLLGRGDSVIARRGGATADDLAWTRGELVFRDASMDDVKADLRRWYGIELVVADSALARQHFNNVFHNDSAEQVLRVLASTFGARIDRQGDTAVLRDAREGAIR